MQRLSGVTSAWLRDAVTSEADRDEAELLRLEGEEELKARLERELNELFQELRALIPGATVLFGFLLAITFTSDFAELGDLEKGVYYATLVSTAVALVLFLAPAAHHRLRFREGDKDHLLREGKPRGDRGNDRRLALVDRRPLSRDRARVRRLGGSRRLGSLLRVRRLALVELRPPAHVPRTSARGSLARGARE